MKHWIITGASRGIGLGLVKELVKSDVKVIATYRDQKGLQALRDLPGQCIPVALDTTSSSSIKEFHEHVKKHMTHVDYLVNNAGLLLDYESKLADVNIEQLAQMMDVNLYGPMRVSQSLLSLLEKSSRPVVLNMSSKMGSITDNSSGRSYGYRISKTALNMFTKTFAIDYPHICTISMHPGWVQTEMGGKNAPLSIDDSVLGILSVLSKVDKNQRGKFLDFKGIEIPW
jgi:NAD(P)-dependent dehydrogenase (short-subunit alcohol dehydrogenase family)